MSQIQQILNYVKNINERLNLWVANAKKVEELPVMNPMNEEGLLIVSELESGIWTSKQLQIQKIIDAISLSGQNNTVREVLLGSITEAHDLNYLLDNSGITVTENEIIILTALETINATLVQKQFLWKLGKGEFNPIGSTNINTKLIELQPKFLNEITVDELTSSPSAIVYDFGIITDPILAVINAADPARDYTDDEKIYYIRATIDNVNYLYNFIGVNGIYGDGESQMTIDDLVLVYSSANANSTDLLIYKLDKGGYEGTAQDLKNEIDNIDLQKVITNGGEATVTNGYINLMSEGIPSVGIGLENGLIGALKRGSYLNMSSSLFDLWQTYDNKNCGFSSVGGFATMYQTNLATNKTTIVNIEPPTNNTTFKIPAKATDGIYTFATTEEIDAFINTLSQSLLYETIWNTGDSNNFTLPNQYYAIDSVVVQGIVLSQDVYTTPSLNTVTILDTIANGSFVQIRYKTNEFISELETYTRAQMDSIVDSKVSDALNEITSQYIRYEETYVSGVKVFEMPSEIAQVVSVSPIGLELSNVAYTLDTGTNEITITDDIPTNTLIIFHYLTKVGLPALPFMTVAQVTELISGSLGSSGTYTPSLTNTANLSSSTLNLATYTKQGNIVTVSLQLSTTMTTADLETLLTFTLPFTTSITTQEGAGNGVTIGEGNGQNGFGIVNIVSGTTAQLVMYPIYAGVTSSTNITFQYKI